MLAVNRTGPQNCVLYLVVVSLLHACSTVQTVTDQNEFAKNPGQHIVNEVVAGDEVTIITKDGATHDLIVTDVTDSGLRGVSCQDCDSIEINIAEIDQLFVEDISAIKSVGAGAGVVFATILVIALVAGPTFSPGL